MVKSPVKLIAKMLTQNDTEELSTTVLTSNSSKNSRKQEPVKTKYHLSLKAPFIDSPLDSDRTLRIQPQTKDTKFETKQLKRNKTKQKGHYKKKKILMTSEQKAITFLMIATMNLIMIIMKMELNLWKNHQNYKIDVKKAV